MGGNYNEISAIFKEIYADGMTNILQGVFYFKIAHPITGEILSFKNKEEADIWLEKYNHNTKFNDKFDELINE